MKKKKSQAAVEAYNSVGNETDVLGSYTGIYRANSGELAIGVYPPCAETLGKADRGSGAGRRRPLSQKIR